MAAVMDAMIGTAAAARLLGVSDNYVRRLAADGRLPCTETPLGRLFQRADVEALVTARERQARECVKTRQIGGATHA